MLLDTYQIRPVSHTKIQMCHDYHYLVHQSDDEIHAESRIFYFRHLSLSGTAGAAIFLLVDGAGIPKSEPNLIR